jgi:predicted metal-dependent hydrolase
VVLPRGRRVDVEEAVRDKLPWIAREYERMAAARSVLRGDEVMFGGSYLRIVHTADTKEELVPNFKAGEVHVLTSDRRQIKELVRRWFLKETSAYVVRKVSELAPLVGAKPSRVDVREIGKWGYCTRGGRLSFSWQLVALPDRLREYVVLHELVHLVEFNHSPAFRRKLSSVCPDFRLREKELDSILPYDRMSAI